MKRLLWGTALLGLTFLMPGSAGAAVSVDINIGLPHIEFSAPPELIVLPGTTIYVVPDAGADIYFYNGFWWRSWGGHYYRSGSYDSGWTIYRSVPSFYRQIPAGWRNDYRNHRWGKSPWNYKRIPHQQVQKTWRGQQSRTREMAPPQSRRFQPAKSRHQQDNADRGDHGKKSKR